jgi:hypothetical protein
MVRLSKAMREDARRIVVRLWVLRLKGGPTDDNQIAQQLGFKAIPGLTVAGAMYRWLENIGLPWWLVIRATTSRPERLDPYVVPEGAKVTPSRGLTQLMAMYALRNWSLETLLDVLHPAPSDADRKGLSKDVEELRKYAGRIARRVRGGAVREGGGRSAPEIPWHELLVSM